MAPPSPRRAALGFSPHIGWAAVVAIHGPPDAPVVGPKRRVVMATTFETGAVYHGAQALPVEEAEALVRSSEERFVATARDGVAAIVAELRDLGLEPIASVVLAGGARPLPPLASILRSHALVHAAEGALYRRVLGRASEACALPVTSVPAAVLPERVARAAGIPPGRVDTILAQMGKASGRPWARDQKDAALAAWLALAGPGAADVTRAADRAPRGRPASRRARRTLPRRRS